MHEIICPHCKKAFKVDEAGYADILKQVRDREFEQQLNERLGLAEKDKQKAVELAREKVKSEMQKAAADKDAEIQGLQAKLDANEVTQKLAITEAVSIVEKERDELKSGLKQAEHRPLEARCPGVDIGEQIREDRHHEFRGGGRRGRTNIRDEVCDGEVDLVPDRADHRDLAVVDRTGHDLFVECPQVLE